MDRVTLAPGTDGLGEMIAGLIGGNLASDPARGRLLSGLRGRVNIHATDAEVGVGVIFAGGSVVVGPAHPKPELEIRCDSATLMDLSAVPLRLGLPDAATPAGREVLRKMRRGELRVRGMVAHPKLLSRLNRLLSVA